MKYRVEIKSKDFKAGLETDLPLNQLQRLALEFSRRYVEPHSIDIQDKRQLVFHVGRAN